MKWFKPKAHVCKECGMLFDPAVGRYASIWPDLCVTHRAPKIELRLREQSVTEWAGRNWERLEKIMKEEETAQHAAYMATAQRGWFQLVADGINTDTGLSGQSCGQYSNFNNRWHWL